MYGRIRKVWQNDVSESTIKKQCFVKTGFSVLLEIKKQDVFSQIQQSSEYLCTQDHITNGILLNKFLTSDDRLIVAIYPTDKPAKYPRDILNLFHKSQKETKEQKK